MRYLRSLERAGVIQKLTILEHQNGLVLSILVYQYLGLQVYYFQIYNLHINMLPNFVDRVCHRPMAYVVSCTPYEDPKMIHDTIASYNFSENTNQNKDLIRNINLVIVYNQV